MAWSANRNAIFLARLWAFADQHRRLREEARQIKELWFANAVSGDPAFVDARGIDTATATDTVVMALDYLSWLEGQVPAQGDRATIIAKMLGGPVEG